MKVYLYDIRRTLRNPAVLAVIAVGAVLGLVVLSVIAGPVRHNSPASLAVVYEYSTGFHFLLYVGDGRGHPIGGAQIQLAATPAYNTTTIIVLGSPGAADPPLNFTANASTDGSGLVRISAAIPSGNYSVTITVHSSSGAFSDLVEGFSVNASSVGVPISALGNIQPVSQGFLPETRALQFFFAAAGGTVPQGYSAGYTLVAGGPGGPQQGPFPKSSVTLLGPLTGYRTLYTPRVPANVSGFTFLVAEIFDPAGRVVATYTVDAPSALPPPPPETEGGQVFQFVATELGIFTPLLAIVAAYGTYGKDRVSGTLESVLSRPVTRTGLGLARFLAIGVAIAVGTALGLIVLDATTLVVVGFGFPVGFLAALYGTLVAEGLAFAGILLLGSRLLRSAGGLIGLAITVFLALALFWPVILLLAASLLGQLDYATFPVFEIHADFFNPAGLVALTVSDLLGVVAPSGGFGAGGVVPASDYGVTTASLALATAFWVGAPLLAFLHLARTRD